MDPQLMLYELPVPELAIWVLTAKARYQAWEYVPRPEQLVWEFCTELVVRVPKEPFKTKAVIKMASPRRE